MLRYAAPQWPRLLLIVVLTGASAALAALAPWPLKILVDYALGSLEPPSGLSRSLQVLSVEPTTGTLIWLAAAAALALAVATAAIAVVLSWTWTAAGQRAAYGLAADLLRRMQRLPLTLHHRREVGDALSRITGDSWAVFTLMDALLVAPFRHLATIAVVGIAAWSLDPQLAVLSLAVAPLLAATARAFGRRVTRRARTKREAESRLISLVQQTLSVIPLVQAYVAQDRTRGQFDRVTQDIVAASQRKTLIKDSYRAVSGSIATAGTAAVLVYGGQRVLSGALSLGTLLVFVSYVQTLRQQFTGLLSIHGDLRAADASVDRVLEVLEVEEEVGDPARPQQLPTAEGGRRVSVEGVSFGYDPGRPVLHDVTLDVAAGEMVALVGRTGAGKTTLAALIPRFADPWQGRIRLDGYDLRDLRVTDVRAQVALVHQDALLLPTSVADNISYGRPDADREQITAAAVAAHADAFIRALPHGYDTVLGERGVTLSGGQRQRLAIARALLTDAPVLILDEPTAALDADTEAALLDTLDRATTGRTTLVIAHRLSTVRRADRIVVVDNGRIHETGTHHDLITTGGLYAHFLSLQLIGSPRRAVA